MLDEKTIDALRMRKEVEITKTWKVIVKEFTTAEVFRLFSFDKLPTDASLDSFSKQVQDYLPMCLEGADLEQLKELPPSKLKEIWLAFKECNSVFFAVAQTMGLGELGERLRSAFVSDFLRTFARSMKPDIPTLSTTVTPIS
jgi:hypothetical protein